MPGLNSCVGSELLLQIEIDDPRLYASGARVRIDAQDLVHPGEVEHHQIGSGHHPRAAVGCSAPGDERHLVCGGHPYDGDHLVTAAGAQQEAGILTDPPIVFAEARQGRGVGDDRARAAQDSDERIDQSGVHGVALLG
jgi:hypothetical protein